MKIASFEFRLRLILELAFLGAVIATLIFAADIYGIFAVIVGALYLFSSERLPVDMTALLVMVTLMVSGLVSPSQGLSGFSSTATITVLAMFILSSGIERTGLMQNLGHLFFRFAGASYFKQIFIIALIIAPISGFLNNTAAVAIFLPMILSLSEKTKTPATKLLIPLSFISMLGGTLTLIGTSTNILASSILPQYGLEPFHIFEFTKLGLVVLVIGVLYFLIAGQFLLPSRKSEEQIEEDIPSNFMAAIQLRQGSKLIGKTIDDMKFTSKHSLKVLKIIRGEGSFIKGLGKKILEEDDILLVYGDSKRIIDFHDRPDERILCDFDVDKRRVTEGKLVKVLLKSVRFTTERKLSETSFAERYGLSVVGIHRKDLNVGKLASLKIKTGEILLVHVSDKKLKHLRKSSDFVVLEEVEDEFDEAKMLTAIGIVVAVILLAALNVLPIVVSSLLGVFMMFLTGCLDRDDVYGAVNWDIIFLLAGVIPLGIAMQTSGSADLIANLIVNLADFLSPLMILMAFYLVTTLITEIISNNAAVVLLVPIGISVADKLILNPIAFVLVVMFAASTSFLSPVGYQTNTMVYGSANYKFTDFVKIGAPLNLILLIVTTSLIYYFYGV